MKYLVAMFRVASDPADYAGSLMDDDLIALVVSDAKTTWPRPWTTPRPSSAPSGPAGPRRPWSST